MTRYLFGSGHNKAPTGSHKRVGLEEREHAPEVVLAQNLLELGALGRGLARELAAVGEELEQRVMDALQLLRLLLELRGDVVGELERVGVLRLKEAAGESAKR